MHPSATETFIGNMRGPIIRPMDADYDAVRSLYNGMIDKGPVMIARCADVEVLILDAEDHVDQRALVGHVIEPAARIPAAIAAHGAVSSVAGVGREDGFHARADMPK